VKYSVEFRESAVQKYLNRGNRPVKEILQELGIAPSSIYQWCDGLAMVGGMKKSSRPQNRPAQQKLKALTEYDALSEKERGEYLRKHGLHEENLNEWRKQIEEALSPYKRNSHDRSELVAEQKKNKQLEKEIRRKDKALAEASALLILKKKADLIWGSGEEE
jgi:transposase